MTARSPLFRWLLAVLLALAATLAVQAQAQAPRWVSVARPEINLRNGPGTQYEAAYSINRGFPLQVLEQQGDWLKVRDFEGDEGWVLARLTDRTAGHHIVTVKVANVRANPSSSARIVGKAEYGELFKTLEVRGDWVRLQLDAKRSGWVAKSLLWGW